MKRVLITSLSAILFIGSPTSETSTAHEDVNKLTLTAEEKKQEFNTKSQIELSINIDGRIGSREELIASIIHVESTGNSKAVGDTHLGVPSIGCMQIRPIMVKEVNRILKRQGKEKRYKLKDRFDRNCSIEMFNIWADAYHKDSSFEKMARNWNGGPAGYKRERTLKYWEKVSTYAIHNL